jgi:hypothetical protein
MENYRKTQTINYPNKYTYEGEINQNELRDGYGILKNPEDIPIYRGDWKNDLYHGNGELYNEDP